MAAALGVSPETRQQAVAIELRLPLPLLLLLLMLLLLLPPPLLPLPLLLLQLIMRRRICTIALKPRNAPSLKSSARNRQRGQCLK